jgi:uncharacterized protein YbcI
VDGSGDPQALTEPDWLTDVDSDDPGSVRAAISNAMVGLKKRYYGKGPERARTYLGDAYVFVALEGGLTRNEETLIAAGEHDAVRDFRLKFQGTMRATTTTAVEHITGRKVIGYHSQITFEPTRSFEIFVLDAPVAQR